MNEGKQNDTRHSNVSFSGYKYQLRPMTIFLAAIAFELPTLSFLQVQVQINHRPLIFIERDQKNLVLASFLLPHHSLAIAQLPEWSSPEFPLVGLQDCSPTLHELLEAREHGDQLNDVHMLVKKAIVVNNLLCWQETYLGMPMIRSDAA